jgi:hypothetical protein
MIVLLPDSGYDIGNHELWYGPLYDITVICQ